MLAGYSSLHKAYRLIATETSRLLYTHDVVFDEQRGLFMLVSLAPDPTNQPLKDHGLGVRLPWGPLDGRALAALVLLVIPVQTPPTFSGGSPKIVDASPEFDPDSSNEEPDNRGSLDANVGPSPLEPKY